MTTIIPSPFAKSVVAMGAIGSARYTTDKTVTVTAKVRKLKKANKTTFLLFICFLALKK